jgi:predicted ATPase/DNA-binding winged helix-turn-helix (wHTH) protein
MTGLWEAGVKMTGSSATEGATVLGFGPFRLIPSRGLLLEGDKPCRLGSRALDILTALVERAGETVSKQDLLARAWPDTFVDDANLRVHVAALRKALGDGQAGTRYIMNVMGRGYCFVAQVTRSDGDTQPKPATRTHPQGRSNLPAPLSRVLGRAEAADAVAVQVPMRRCVSVVGPGGIGKTTFAIAVGERLLPVYDGGVWFIDMASVAERHQIPFAMASVLGVSIASSNPIPTLVNFLRDKHLLLLIDNCEHLVDTIAPLVETILRQAPHVHILATSREALRAEGEWIYRLKPMETPPEGDRLTADDALRFDAVQLFVERASASLDGYRLTDADAPAAAEICRRLDGLPLAIELIAARIDLFGVRGLATMLNDHFLLVSEGQRTAQPRQQNLLGALDWSYRLLSSIEQTILCRLAVFHGDFTLDAAVAVATGNGVSQEQIYSGILTLSSKSLITTDVTSVSREHHHRLLHVTRAFVAQKLALSQESHRIIRLHAEYLCRLFAQAEADWEQIDRHVWLATYGRTIDDVRAALDWAFSPEGDAAIGVALTASAVPIGFQLSLIEEVKAWLERALMHAPLLAVPQPLAEMRLNVALGRLAHNMGVPQRGQTTGFDRAIELSQQLGRPVYRTEPLIALAALNLNTGDYGAGVAVAREAQTIAETSGDAKAVLAVERIAAQVHHFNGDHAAAERFANAVLDYPVGQIPLAYNTMPVDRRVSMRVVLARIAWLRGCPQRAITLVQESIDHAARDSAFSLCQVLAIAAIPIALWSGDDAGAAEMTGTLDEQATRCSLTFWRSWATAYQALLRMRAGTDREPPRLLGSLQLETFATFSTDLLEPVTLQRAENGQAGWCRAELFRAQGEWLLAQGAPGAAKAAEGLFNSALEISRAQGAHAWELRAAISLTRLWQRQGRAGQGLGLVAGALQHLTGNSTIVDVQEAKELLARMAPGDRRTPPTSRLRQFA